MTELCGAVHPDDQTVDCNRPGSGARANHKNHTGLSGDDYVDWPNEAYTAPPPKQSKGRKAASNKELEAMATRTRTKKKEAKDAPEVVLKQTFYPTEETNLGRVALYLLKYLNEWIDVTELELDTVAGSAAQSKVQELINIGWPIAVKVAAGEGPKYRLMKDPRKPLWQLNSHSSIATATNPVAG